MRFGKARAVAIEDDAIGVNRVQADARPYAIADGIDFRLLRRLADDRQALLRIFGREDRREHERQLRLGRRADVLRRCFRRPEQMSVHDGLNIHSLGTGRRRGRGHDRRAVDFGRGLEQQPGQLDELPSDGDGEDCRNDRRQRTHHAVQPLLRREALKLLKTGREGHL
jgi:hypothetical protein